MESNRRNFFRQSFVSATGLAAATMLLAELFGQSLYNTNRTEEIILQPEKRSAPKESIRFSVIGINHNHILGMVDSLIAGGGQMVAVYSKEPELLPDFTKRYPNVKVARNEAEILEDNSIQLIASASIPVDRAPLGIRVMQSGKDFMTDKPGILTFDQFREVKKVQKKTNRIYSIVYSERLGNPASVKAGELILSGAIGKVVQTIGIGPHRMRPKTRPDWFFYPEKAGGICVTLDHISATSFLHQLQTSRGQFFAIGNFINLNIPNIRLWDMSVRSPHATGYIRRPVHA